MADLSKSIYQNCHSWPQIQVKLIWSDRSTSEGKHNCTLKTDISGAMFPGHAWAKACCSLDKNSRIHVLANPAEAITWTDMDMQGEICRPWYSREGHGEMLVMLFGRNLMELCMQKTFAIGSQQIPILPSCDLIHLCQPRPHHVIRSGSQNLERYVTNWPWGVRRWLHG